MVGRLRAVPTIVVVASQPVSREEAILIAGLAVPSVILSAGLYRASSRPWRRPTSTTKLVCLRGTGAAPKPTVTRRPSTKNGLGSGTLAKLAAKRPEDARRRPLAAATRIGVKVARRGESAVAILRPRRLAVGTALGPSVLPPYEARKDRAARSVPGVGVKSALQDAVS